MASASAAAVASEGRAGESRIRRTAAILWVRSFQSDSSAARAQRRRAERWMQREQLTASEWEPESALLRAQVAERMS